MLLNRFLHTDNQMVFSSTFLLFQMSVLFFLRYTGYQKNLSKNQFWFQHCISIGASDSFNFLLPVSTVVEVSTSASASKTQDVFQMFEKQIGNISVPAKILFFFSYSRLVIDLQQRVKAQSNPIYDRKVKLSNLQQMAKTIAYVQERGYSTEDDLMTALTRSQSETTNCRKNLRYTQQELKKFNEPIHYTGQYIANKSVYWEFSHAKNKKKFRQKHLSEITLYETARNFLKQQAASKKLPSMKLLKSEKKNCYPLKICSIRNIKKENNTKKNCRLYVKM